MRKPPIKTRSSTILMMEAAIRYRIGLRLSPTDCKILCTYVVHDHSNAAHKVHAEVGDGVNQYVVRRAHPTQDLRE